MIGSYHVYDARRICEKVARNSVQLTITSPPYAYIKNYGGVEKQIGYGQNYIDYIDDLGEVFAQIYEVSIPSASLWVIMDTFREKGELKLLPFEFAQHIRRSGWKLKDIVIWHKTKTLPWYGKGQIRNIFEYILFFTKSDEYKYYIDRITEPLDLKQWWVKYPERYRPLGKAPENIWEFTIPTQGSWGNGELRHACPFPFALTERIIDLCSDKGDIVLDPFAGTGTVLAQASCMDRQYIGLDVNPSYKNMFESVVLQESQRQWQVRLLERERETEARQQLLITIPRLRQLKYPKQLIRELSKLYSEAILFPPIHTILTIGQENDFIPDKNRYMKEYIYLFIDGMVYKDLQGNHLENAIRLISNRPPLSKYGIDAEISILPIDNIAETAYSLPEPEVSLSLYSRGRFWWASDQKSLKEWLPLITTEDWRKNSLNGIPPILSNIYVRQAIPKY